MIVYETQDLSKIYPRQQHPANKHISLRIYQGEIFGLLGNNGAGKTTLVRQMANLLKPTSGMITLFGRPVGQDPHWVPIHVGYMPQEGAALNNLTVGEALYFTAHLCGANRVAARREYNRLLDLWQIRDLANKPSSRLSGGERRLLRLAVSTAGNPPVLILDEPTNDLDPQRRRLVWDILRQINATQGTTIIFITHDAVEAEKVVARVGIICAGELVAVGRPGDLKQAVDRKLRLELLFNPATPPSLPNGLTSYLIQPGRWLIYLDRDDAAWVLDHLDLSRIEDFRLYSATLEDLYVYYANQTLCPTFSDPIV